MNSMTIDDMIEEMQLTVSHEHKRVLSQALSLIATQKDMPELPPTTKRFQRADKKWQIYKIKTYDRSLLNHFRNLVFALELA